MVGKNYRGDEMAELRRAAEGRWHSILGALGVDEHFLTGRHGPCPACGGKDRFRFDDKDGRGTWICNPHGQGCGAGDGFDLLMRLRGWTFPEAKKAVGEVLPGSVSVIPPKDDEKIRASLNAIRKQAVRASDVPEVVRYLANRGLEVPPGLEAVSSLGYYHERKLVANYPAMLGKVVTRDGRPVTYHRTYLHDGKKAPVESPRKMMRTMRKTKGWAIRLYPADNELVIAEGIETAIACKMLWDIPAWSVVSAGGMLDFELPAGIRRVIIAGDNDTSFTGQAAAYEKARRLVGTVAVEVRIPETTGDWNDYAIVRLRNGENK